jgi:hypothetical protein
MEQRTTMKALTTTALLALLLLAPAASAEPVDLPDEAEPAQIIGLVYNLVMDVYRCEVQEPGHYCEIDPWT